MEGDIFYFTFPLAAKVKGEKSRKVTADMTRKSCYQLLQI
jgi:hypothetical protein